MTREWSRVRSRLFTVPKTISRYLSCDWPACNPSAVSKETVIVGPCFDSVSQASQAPIAIARIGIIQMTGTRRDRLVRARTGACGTLDSLIRNLAEVKKCSRSGLHEL